MRNRGRQGSSRTNRRVPDPAVVEGNSHDSRAAAISDMSVPGDGAGTALSDAVPHSAGGRESKPETLSTAIIELPLRPSHGNTFHFAPCPHIVLLRRLVFTFRLSLTAFAPP